LRAGMAWPRLPAEPRRVTELVRRPRRGTPRRRTPRPRPAACSSPRRGTVVVLQLAELAPHPANPREDLGDLDELQASMGEVGVLQPAAAVAVTAHLAAGCPAVVEGQRMSSWPAAGAGPQRSRPAKRRSGAWSAMTWPARRRWSSC
jgi:hypothetical protein